MLKALFMPDVPFETLYIPYIYKEIYFDGLYQDILNGRKDLTILDVGANIGVVTDYMRNYAKRLLAIEPSPEHFEALKQNKEYNHWDNVELFNIALADKDRDDLKIAQNPSNRTMNTLIVDPEKVTPDGGYAVNQTFTNAVATMFGTKYKSSVPVLCKGFDTFLEENKVDNVDFVKFDVEGAEDVILRSEGFKKIAPKIKAIEVEFHFPNWQQLVEYMIGLGFGNVRRYDCSAIVVLFTR